MVVPTGAATLAGGTAVVVAGMIGAVVAAMLPLPTALVALLDVDLDSKPPPVVPRVAIDPVNDEDNGAAFPLPPLPLFRFLDDNNSNPFRELPRLRSTMGGAAGLTRRFKFLPNFFFDAVGGTAWALLALPPPSPVVVACLRMMVK